MTIHQPREHILTLFDELILLSEGRIVYSGSIPGTPFVMYALACSVLTPNTCAGALKHFEDCGLPCAPNTNPSDFFLDTMTIDFRSAKLREQSLIRVKKLQDA